MPPLENSIGPEYSNTDNSRELSISDALHILESAGVRPVVMQVIGGMVFYKKATEEPAPHPFLLNDTTLLDAKRTVMRHELDEVIEAVADEPSGTPIKNEYSQRISGNAACPCRSGKKFKNCCNRRE